MKIDHIGVAVSSLDESARFYKELLGLVEVHREEVLSQKVRVAFLVDPSELGGTAIELLEPTAPEASVAKFIGARGPGLHHLAFAAPLVAPAMDVLRKGGAPPLEAAPREGARGHQICFVHPKHCGGVLIELVGG
ncbi:MAG: methylmalonyl-CoA epimerase [Elusimicrobia bacterium]|nr:methylmalonyl-CoA epimerase [Elusimicrobiota bacterium]